MNNTSMVNVVNELIYSGLKVIIRLYIFYNNSYIITFFFFSYFSSFLSFLCCLVIRFE